VHLRVTSLFGAVTVGLMFSDSARAQQPEPVVTGITLAPSFGPGPDTVVYRRTITSAGRDTAAGTRTVVFRVRQVGKGSLLEVVQRFPAGGGTIIDTAIAELPTLRALAHQSHQPTKTMRFDFGPSEVTGVVQPVPAGVSAASPEPVRQDVGGPVFDSNLIEYVVAALPLAPELVATLPFFIYERGGRVPMAVKVRERVTVTYPALGPRDSWVVTVAVPGAPATIWVDAETRAVLCTRYDITARGMAFTDDRLTPLSRKN
jgi:hypothetical protein